MQCIFCKEDSSKSKSVEHIIPESLGNIEHTLPKGVVCDSCNNYFARKIEKPLLDSAYFQLARFRNSLANKEGRIPTAKGIHLQSRTVVEIYKDDEGLSIYPMKENDVENFAQSLLTKQCGSLVFPIAPKEESDKRLISRFIGKIAIEALAQRLIPVEGGQDEIVNKKEMDELRNYVRRNIGKSDWPIYENRIYEEDSCFEEDGSEYQILHEFTFLYTPQSELYFAIAILGMEYVINMAGPEIDSYKNWLSQNGNKSPLM